MNYEGPVVVADGGDHLAGIEDANGAEAVSIGSAGSRELGDDV